MTFGAMPHLSSYSSVFRNLQAAPLARASRVERRFATALHFVHSGGEPRERASRWRAYSTTNTREARPYRCKGKSADKRTKQIPRDGVHVPPVANSILAESLGAIGFERRYSQPDATGKESFSIRLQIVGWGGVPVVQVCACGLAFASKRASRPKEVRQCSSRSRSSNRTIFVFGVRYNAATRIRYCLNRLGQPPCHVHRRTTESLWQCASRCGRLQGAIVLASSLTRDIVRCTRSGRDPGGQPRVVGILCHGHRYQRGGITGGGRGPNLHVLTNGGEKPCEYLDGRFRNAVCPSRPSACLQASRLPMRLRLKRGYLVHAST